MIGGSVRSWQPGDVWFLLAMAMPFVQWLPIREDTESYVTLYTSTTLFAWGGLLLLAAWIAAQDRWLGALCAWGGIHMLVTPGVVSHPTLIVLSVGCAGIALVRRFDERRRRLARNGLIVMGAVQAAVGTFEFANQGFHGLVLGTLLGQDFYGVYLGMLAPLAPVWLLPLYALGLLSSKCLTGIAAATVGLFVRFKGARPRIAGLGGALFLAAWWVKRFTPDNFMARWDTWMVSLRHETWPAWLIGHGPGSWKTQLPAFLEQDKVWLKSIMPQAHNDWVQLNWEFGLGGVLIVLIWCWTHRRMFTNEYGGAVAAVAVGAMGIFTFHMPDMGLVAVLILGLATSTGAEGER